MFEAIFLREMRWRLSDIQSQILAIEDLVIIYGGMSNWIGDMNRQMYDEIEKATNEKPPTNRNRISVSLYSRLGPGQYAAGTIMVKKVTRAEAMYCEDLLATKLVWHSWVLADISIMKNYLDCC